MTNIPVATDDVFALILRECAHVLHEVLHENQLACLPLIAARAGGKVKRGDAQLPKVRLNITAFGVSNLEAEASGNIIGLLSAIDRRARVAFFLRIEVMAVVALWCEDRVTQLIQLRFSLLQANYIGVDAGQPIKEALARSGANAVAV